MKLLLGSGGFSTPERKEGWRQALDQFLGNIQSLLFVPYALDDHDAYVSKMVELNFQAGRKLIGIHTTLDARIAIQKAEAIYVGGGNSFRLLNALYQYDLVNIIRERVLKEGLPFVGISAGTNMACPTLKTTNDMPIVAPPSFKALGLIPFQINPHYFSGPIYMKAGEKFTPYGGETRDDRIHQFHEDNEIPVLGLWEGSVLAVNDQSYKLQGTAGARLFRREQPELDFETGADLSEHLGITAEVGDTTH